jgi:hypothetical protein
VYAKNQALPLPDAPLDIVLRGRGAASEPGTKRRLPLVGTGA